MEADQAELNTPAFIYFCAIITIGVLLYFKNRSNDPPDEHGLEKWQISILDFFILSWGLTATFLLAPAVLVAILTEPDEEKHKNIFKQLLEGRKMA